MKERQTERKTGIEKDSIVCIHAIYFDVGASNYFQEHVCPYCDKEFPNSGILQRYKATHFEVRFIWIASIIRSI
jgi:hypothetical protein